MHVPCFVIYLFVKWGQNACSTCEIKEILPEENTSPTLLPLWESNAPPPRPPPKNRLILADIRAHLCHWVPLA